MNVLTNKTVKSNGYFSRDNGFYYYYNLLDNKNQMQTKAWLQENSQYETVYTVKEGDTYDSIALEQYNNPTYYWIICDYNRIIDPFIGPKVGDKLYLPALGLNLVFESY